MRNKALETTKTSSQQTPKDKRAQTQTECC